MEERSSEPRETMADAAEGGPIELRLSATEIGLLRTGLEMLEDTFGHEEAEELEEVQALLAKLPRVGSSAG